MKAVAVEVETVEVETAEVVAVADAATELPLEGLLA
jgi:hypothetical protein